MKIREVDATGVCMGCRDRDVELTVVVFETHDKAKLLCDTCLEWTREVLALVDVKEAEA